MLRTIPNYRWQKDATKEIGIDFCGSTDRLADRTTVDCCCRKTKTLSIEKIQREKKYSGLWTADDDITTRTKNRSAPFFSLSFSAWRGSKEFNDNTNIPAWDKRLCNSRGILRKGPRGGNQGVKRGRRTLALKMYIHSPFQNGKREENWKWISFFWATSFSLFSRRPFHSSLDSKSRSEKFEAIFSRHEKRERRLWNISPSASSHRTFLYMRRSLTHITHGPERPRKSELSNSRKNEIPLTFHVQFPSMMR